ncbi:MAG: hypothetical protein ACP5QI_04885 [Candidatus Bathyarchaeia archaeon]
MSEEEILAVIKRHPEVIAEALEGKPNVLTSLVVRLAPWDRFATKDDIKMLMEFTEKRFGDINKRFEDVDKRFEDINKRFEDINKRFEDINKRFEDVNKRFDDINKRFEDVNGRFEDLIHYIDKRVGLVEKLLIGFNIPILTAVIVTLVRLFLY